MLGGTKPAVPYRPRNAGAPGAPVTSLADDAEAQKYSAARRLPRFGVALFDNEMDMSAGWACASDGDAFYFSHINQLTNDTIWVTSLEWNEYQNRGRQMHNLRRIDYLKTSILRIATDLGLRTDGHHARQAAYALARVVQESLAIAAQAYGWKDPAREINDHVLYEDIRRTIVQPPKSKPHILPALAQAYQGSSSPPWPPGYDESVIAVTLRVNRLRYVQSLLDKPVPDEGWSVELRGEKFRTAGLTLDSLLDPARPSLVEATVEMNGTDPEVAAIVAYGSQPGKRSTLRRWISQPELAWLVRHANVHIQTAMISLDQRQLPDAAKLPASLTADPMFAMSLSAGLVAESHFQAIASETYSTTLRRKIVSAWAVWMRAYDRAAMFELALAAHRSGFVPIAYGGGAVTVKLQKSRMAELLLFAQGHGIAHPALHPHFVEHGYAEAGKPLPEELFAGLPRPAPMAPPADGSVDLDVVQRIALRAAPLTEPGTNRPITMWSQLDGVAEHVSSNRPVLVGKVLAEAAKADPAVAPLIKESGIAAALRADVMRRREGALADAAPLYVKQRPEEESPDV